METLEKIGLTREVVRDWYLREVVQKALREQTGGKKLSFRCFSEDGGLVHRRNLTTMQREKAISVGWKNPKAVFVEWGFARQEKDALLTWPYWVEQGVLEVHAETCENGMFGPRIDRIIVDLDPEGEISAGTLVEVTTQILDLLDRHFPLRGTEVHYSGNRSLHVIGLLPHPVEAEELRGRVTRILARSLPPSLCRLKQSSDRWPYLFVDLGPMREKSTLRCLGSLHHKTGKVCVRLDMDAPRDRFITDLLDPTYATREWALDHPESLFAEGSLGNVI